MELTEEWHYPPSDVSRTSRPRKNVTPFSASKFLRAALVIAQSEKLCFALYLAEILLAFVDKQPRSALSGKCDANDHVSYRRADPQGTVGRIRDRLVSEYGRDAVFMDIDDIDVGQDFRSVIKKAVSNSDILLVIIGPRWLGARRNRISRIEEENDTVRLEIETAVAARRRPKTQALIEIFPVLIDGAKMPKAEQLPESLKEFVFFNAAHVGIAQYFNSGMERLIRSIARARVSLADTLRLSSEGQLELPNKSLGLDKFPFDPIARDLWTGTCIPLLGAGASSFPSDIETKPPSARALAWELAEVSGYPPYRVAVSSTGSDDMMSQKRIMRAQFECEDLAAVSSWIEHGLGDRELLHSSLRAHLADEQKLLPPNALHHLLGRMAQQTPMAIISTNYDDLMEQALLQRDVPFDLFVVAIDRQGIYGRARGTTLFRPAGRDELAPVSPSKRFWTSNSPEVRFA